MLKKIESRIILAEKTLAGILLIFIVSAAFYKMIARNFFTSEFAINSSDTISSFIPHCVLIVGLLGASIGISRSQVISIDLFSRFFRENHQKILQSVVYFFTCILCAVFTILAIQSVEFGDKYWILAGYIPALTLLFLKTGIKVFQ